jgi:predicted ester cyclase
LGDGLGFSATQRDVAFTGMLLVEVEEGKITKAWNEFDFLNMYRQLGAFSLVDPSI